MIGSTSLFPFDLFLGNSKSITLLQINENFKAERKRERENKDKWRNPFVVLREGIKEWKIGGKARLEKLKKIKKNKGKCRGNQHVCFKTQTKSITSKIKINERQIKIMGKLPQA